MSARRRKQTPLRAIARVRRASVALVAWFEARQFSENAVLLGFAVFTGVLGALGVVAFYSGIDLAYEAFYRWPGEHLPKISFLIYRPVVTALGMALAWWVMRRLGHGHDGLNVPDVQSAVVRRGGRIPVRPALARTAASAITIGSGASAGSEGPVVVLGAMAGSWLSRVFRFAPERTVVLVGCATGAAISAAFNAPLAGAFFALEEILGAFSVASFSPVVIASVVAALVSRAVFGNHPAFPIPEEYGYASAVEVFAFYPLLGVVCAVAAAAYVRCYFASEDAATRLKTHWRVPSAALPWIGGAAVGLLVFASGGVLVGYGHLAVHLEVFGGMPWYLLLVLAMGAIVATSITLNFGGSGGVFTPALYIGAATGGAVGVALASLFPDAGIRPEAYALVGMGAMVAGSLNAPITGILLVFEMTNDYAIMVPLMLTVVVCQVVSRRWEPDSLYTGWLRRRGQHLEHGTDRDALSSLLVRDAYDPGPLVIRDRERVSALLHHLGNGEQTRFPVVDGDGALLGVISAAELGQAAAERRELDLLLVAADIAGPSESVGPDDTLRTAVRKMGVRGADALPVVDPATGRLVGMVSRHHALQAYQRRLGEAGG